MFIDCIESPYWATMPEIATDYVAEYIEEVPILEQDNNPHHKELKLMVEPVLIENAKTASVYHRWFKLPIMEVVK